MHRELEWWSSPIRPLRRGMSVHAWPAAIAVRCPEEVKDAVKEAARSANMGQGEFGLRVLMAALADPRWLASALRDDSRQVFPIPAEQGGQDGNSTCGDAA